MNEETEMFFKDFYQVIENMDNKYMCYYYTTINNQLSFVFNIGLKSPENWFAAALVKKGSEYLFVKENAFRLQQEISDKEMIDCLLKSNFIESYCIVKDGNKYEDYGLINCYSENANREVLKGLEAEEKLNSFN